MSEFNIEDLDAVIARSREGSLAQMLALQLKGQIRKGEKLAAENVGLKATSDDRRMFIMNGVQLGYIKVPTVETDPALETIRIAVSPQEPTPATDTYLAEIKSHDLNAFISHYSAELDEHIANGGDQFDATSIRLRGFIVGGRMFREKLRDEDKALALREGAK